MDKLVEKINKLIVRIAKGDTYALDELFVITGRMLLFMARKYLYNKSYAEDLVSETYLKVVKSADSFDKKQNGLNWLYKIVKNGALNHNLKERNFTEPIPENVADKDEIITRKAGEDQAWKWVSNGIDGFEISEATRESNGTDITLSLKEDDKNYTDTIYLRQIIRTYSDHIEYPIVLELGDAGEETVNTASALWTRHKSEITEEQYKEFYHHISRNFDDPWMTLHFKAEGNIEYTGLLFIPSETPYDLFQPDKKNGLKLYVNKVFISDKVEALIPNYLRFVKGVIDSADLQLNISREMLQHSALIEKIKHGTVSRLLKELKKRSKDYDDYMKFWKNFGIAFKEGIYEDCWTVPSRHRR